MLRLLNQGILTCVEGVMVRLLETIKTRTVRDSWYVLRFWSSYSRN